MYAYSIDNKCNVAPYQSGGMYTDPYYGDTVFVGTRVISSVTLAIIYVVEVQPCACLGTWVILPGCYAFVKASFSV